MKPLDPIEDEIEAARRRAHVFEGRGNREAALAALAEVVEKYPDHPNAREAHADILIAAGKLEEAKEVLGALVKEFPGRIETERKHARLVLKLDERNISAALLLGEGDLTALMNPAGAKRSAGTAALLSLLAPGFGQIFNGELVRGLTMLGISVVLWILFFTVGYTNEINLVGWVLAALLVVLYVGCLLDAAVSAPKHAMGPPPPRPTPPVDKPFE